MKCILQFAAALCAVTTSAFVVPQPLLGSLTLTRTTTLQLKAVPLQAEPVGGEELTALTTMPNCRMMKMQELPNVKVPSDVDGVACNFWMTAVAEGVLIKEIRTQIEKDASKKANFPGFRKVRLMILML
jgi:hypothetical protein